MSWAHPLGPLGLGLLDVAGLQRRHRADRALRLILDACHGGRWHADRFGLLRHGTRCLRSWGVRHPQRPPDRHRRGRLPDGVACRNRRGSSDVQGRIAANFRIRDDRGSGRLSPARFDAGVVAGAKPAPFRGIVEPCHPTLREQAPLAGAGSMKSSSAATVRRRTCETDALLSTRGAPTAQLGKTSDHAPAWIELKDIAQSGSGRIENSRLEYLSDVRLSLRLFTSPIRWPRSRISRPTGSTDANSFGETTSRTASTCW